MIQDSGTLSIPSELPINSGFTIHLKPSKGLIVIFSVFLLCVLTAISIAHINPWLKLILLVFVLLYMTDVFNKHLLMKHPLAIRQITLTDFNWCFVCYNNQQVIKADILPDSVLTEHLVILNLKPQAEISGWRKWIQNLSCQSVLVTRGRVGEKYFKDLKRRLRLINFREETATSETQQDS